MAPSCGNPGREHESKPTSVSGYKRTLNDLVELVRLLTDNGRYDTGSSAAKLSDTSPHHS